MAKKTISSSTGSDKSKTESPTIRSSISSSQSQKKPLTPSATRDIKSGVSNNQPPRSAPEAPPIARRPATPQMTPGKIAGVAGAAAGAAVVGATQSQAAEHESRMALLRSRWDSVAGKATLAPLYSGMDAMTNQLNALATGVSDLRARGYRYGRGWEEQVVSLQGGWARQRDEATRILEDERRNLESATYDVQNLLNRAARDPGLVNTADTRVRDFERRVGEAERHVNGVYDRTRQTAAALRQELAGAEFVIDALESASFQLYPGESGVRACKVEWYARGAEPLEGLLFLTDGRLLFEQRQEVVTKKVLFFKTEKKMQQELLWYAPIGGVEVVGMEDKKELLKARKELLTLRLEGGDAPHEVTLNLVDAQNEEWARLLKRAQEGQFDAERAAAAEPAAAGEKAESEPAAVPAAGSADTPLPTKCPSCNAALPTIYRGMREIRCAYCDTVIRLG